MYLCLDFRFCVEQQTCWFLHYVIMIVLTICIIVFFLSMTCVNYITLNLYNVWN